MGDVNRDIRVVWERDYPHLMYDKLGSPRKFFRHNRHEFQLGAIYDSLFVVKQDDLTHLVADINTKELRSKYFLDLFNPSEEELVLFELEYGFEWPFQEKNKTINIKEN